MNPLNFLVEKKLVREEDLPSIEAEIRASGGDVEKVLLARGIDRSDILAARGAYLNIPSRIVDVNAVPYEVLKYIPEESATHYRFVPIGLEEGVLEVGIVDPDNIEARDALNFISSKINLPFKLFLISEEDYEKVIGSYKGLSGEVGQALSELDTELAKKGDDSDSDFGKAEELTPTKKDASGAKIIEDAPVTKIVATMLRYAIEGNASDIHIEPTSDKLRVRFRVDGDLNTSLILPMTLHRSVIARIKILSNMKLDEKRKPQDGRFSARIEGREVDFRVSTFPTYYGEKLVMRILDKDKGIHALDQLGLREPDLAMIRRAIKKPYGMILISGPTGSGKSTTLYSMLSEVDRSQKNVLSLEDPVEFNIEGVSQSQIRPEIDYTFANGLRTTLRQDPDIIMVGEIRDKETAQLAVQAALTGHLVLSTIHTNNAIGVIPRLIDMGVDPFLIAPTLILTIAQRLVRTLCPNGGKEMPIEGSIRGLIDESFEDLPTEAKKLKPVGNLYGLAQTADCPNGTRGRMAVFEMFEMDKELEGVILKDPTDITIEKTVRAKGMLTLQEDALIKCSQRLVPFEEVNTLV